MNQVSLANLNIRLSSFEAVIWVVLSPQTLTRNSALKNKGPPEGLSSHHTQVRNTTQNVMSFLVALQKENIPMGREKSVGKRGCISHPHLNGS